MTLGHLIKRRRLELELTQQELAQRLGVGQNYVAYLESGQRKPSQELMEKLVKAIRLNFDELYFAAYPKLENKFKSETKRNDKLLDALEQSTVLRQSHGISDAEIRLLRSVQPLGKIKSEEDYIKLLLSIRKVYKSE